MGKACNKKEILRHICIFLVCIVVCGLISAGILSVLERYKREDAKLQAEQTRSYMETILKREIAVTDIMKSWLEALGEDEMRQLQSDAGSQHASELFEEMASHLYEDDFIRALELQPNGINRYVYPAEANEKAIGQDVFHLNNNEQRKKDAEKSRETGETVVTGPLELTQGGEALLVRNPIYYHDGTFWGFALAVLDVPGVFDSFGLKRLENDGFAYEFECYHADETSHVIASREAGMLDDPVCVMLQANDKQWQLKVAPEDGWVTAKAKNLTMALCIFISVVITAVYKILHEDHQRTMESMRMEIESKTRADVLEEEKKRLESYDGLTGCLNLHGFRERASRRIRENQDKDYAVAYFDIKQFKVVNEKIGFKQGDEILKFIVQKQATLLRGTEIIGRISGDIFVMLVYYDDEWEQGERFRILNEDMKAYMDEHQYDFNLVIHMGLYVLGPEDRQNPDINKIIDNANFAQKSIQSQPVSRMVLYTGEYRSEQIWKSEISKHLTAAIRDGEVVVWLQPQFNYESGQIVGAEVLCRWNHNTLGFLSPARFIPILEETGQITELDMFVWEEACRLMKKWDEEGKKISLSVNVSRKDIAEPDIEQYLQKLVQKYGLAPSRLKLEITETAYTENSQQLLDIVNKLHDMGFIIEMDDFGTGYSSLNMLKEIPVDVLKLDMRFLSGAGNLIMGKKIIASIIQTTHSTDISVIAEGVETEEQAVYLDAIGCAVMQGYYYSKPLPVDEFEELLSTRKLNMDMDKFFVLEQLEAELAANNELVPVGIIKYEANEQQKLRYVSSSLLRMLGYTRKQFTQKFGNRFSNIIYEEDREYVLSDIKKQLQTSRYDYCEYRIEAADGELIWVADRGHLVTDSLGKSWFYAAIVRMGKTKRRRSYQGGFVKDGNQEDLSAAVRELMEMMPGGAFCYDVDDGQEFAFVSNSMMEMLGYTPQEFQKKFNNRFPDMIYEEDRERVLEEIEEQIQTGDVDYCMYRIETADGRLKWVYDRGRVIVDEDGRRWFYVVILDMDELKESDSI